MPQKYEQGDLVQLKSGGPVMTVKKHSNRNGYRCTWFKGQTLQAGWFEEGQLVDAEEEDDESG